VKKIKKSTISIAYIKFNRFLSFLLAPNLRWKIFGWLASFTNSAGIWLSHKTIGGGVAHAKIRRGRRATATRESIETPLFFMKKFNVFVPTMR